MDTRHRAPSPSMHPRTRANRTSRISTTDDLSFLFAAYDARFLDGLCGKLLGPVGVSFRLSSRMTRAGGETTRHRRPDGTPHFEIALATSILFDDFLASDPVVTVCGLPCDHRLGALQRLFEHELVHLAEWLCWDESHCNRERFQGIAARLFGHRAHTHQLVTRSEGAAELGIGVGTLVSFRYQGRWLQGRVNRITKRATVLVGDPKGELWSDRQRYVRYYRAPRRTPPGLNRLNRGLLRNRYDPLRRQGP